jgi:putative flippase GtrA
MQARQQRLATSLDGAGPDKPVRCGFDAYWRRPAAATVVQFLRYTCVGGLAYLIDFGTLYLLTEAAGIHYLVSAIWAFGCGLTVNYFLSVTWVFSQRRLSSRRLEFAVFGLVGLVGLGLNELVLWVLTERGGRHYLVSKLGSALIVFLWNFVARKVVLFRAEAAR